MGKNLHVVPNNGNWAVKTEGAERASRVAITQKEAIDIARRMAIKNQSELLIHGENGRVRQKNSYGNDEYPPKG